MKLSTPKQRQDLGYVRKLIGLDDDSYKEILSDYKVETSKKLTSKQINELINRLRDKAKETGAFKPKKSYGFQHYKYNNLGEREGMASPAQLRKIEAMWYRVSRQKTDEDREKALNTMIRRITKRDNVKFLTSTDAKKMIETIEHM